MNQARENSMTMANPFRPHLEWRQSGPSIDIRTDTESFLAGCLQSDDSNIGTSFQQTQTRFERRQHFRIQSVQLLRPMQGNPCDGRVRRDLNFGRVSHWDFLFLLKATRYPNDRAFSPGDGGASLPTSPACSGRTRRQET